MELKKSSVLIVDDQPKNIQVAANILKGQGYNMAFAQNGRTAIAQIKNNKFDLILLDIMMPDMDGFEVCQKLRNNSDTKDIPVIFLTAKTDMKSIVKGFKIGATDYVTKPFNGDELLARVTTHLELYKSKKQLVSLNNQLTNEIEERKRIEKALESANADKDRFFSIIAHDLKSPFSILINVTDLLINKFLTFNDEQKIQFLTEIKESATQTHNLLLNLLEWSRIQTNRISFNPIKLEIISVINEAILLLKPNADKKNINLYSEIEKGIYVYADYNMIGTVFRNLLSNAVKFTRRGGTIKVTAKKIGDQVEIMVSDDGVGIKKEIVAKLFKIDEYHSTKGTEKETGTGLGLVLCREFVEKNSGNIIVESEEGIGSKFKIYLPDIQKYENSTNF